MTYEPIWGAIIAWYLFLAGLGAGAFATSAFIMWKHPTAVGMRRIGHFIAPIAVIIGLILLMIDAQGGLHNPERFFYLLTDFGSVMTWGVVFLGIFTIISIIVVILELMKKRIPVWLEITGVVLAVCVATYTGALLGVCKTFPLWNNAMLPILFLVSAMSTGAASVLLVSVWPYPKEFNEAKTLRKFHYCFPLIELVLIASLLFITSSTNTAGWASVMNMINGECAFMFWFGIIFIGIVLPTGLETVLLFFSSKKVEESRTAHLLSALSDAGILVGGFLLRLIILLAAVPISVIAVGIL